AEREARNGHIFHLRHPHHLPQVNRFRTTVDCHMAAHAVRVESSGKLRVALDFRLVPPQYMGTSAYAINLARELSRRPEIELTLVVHQPAQAHGIAARVLNAGQSL